MRILAVSDMHGDLSAVKPLIVDLKPDALFCCGDWGDPGQVPTEDYRWTIDQTYVLSVFGNHDDIDLLAALRNRDGTPVLLANGETRRVGPVTVAGISGIWAKSHQLPWYTTDREVVAAAEKADKTDVLLTHGCAVGLADTLPGGRHGGRRCFLEAFQRVRPRVYLCGHLHFQQMKHLKDGSIALNVGNSAVGDYALIEVSDGEWEVRTERWESRADMSC